MPRFEQRIFSATDVAHPKPAPDLFLQAARRMEVPPRDCLVIEDTPTGVRAGVAAGMRVLGFSLYTPAQRLRDAGAATVFADMALLPELIDGGA